ncbi:FAD-binding oxidoreductase [Rhodococcus sp. (in: high G+C Gram-positive bacteria)]|uniref:FAD-binding oxidoreductase n=1 Tax=Rhodococcus sp. TaxID=1831 RepID=UPI00257CAE15|nr:FAD-binding oxidoreductase [Rhodococcus sp. (in: high G+C Gram-positive bacteria)]MBQ7804045.1 FAD-binding oxidoreductase [Rhodococcus sp. (in: high G+C Gram-positive bacteria)]
MITASDANYDEARAIWNGDVHRRPHAVVQVTDVEDVVNTIRYAGEAELPLAVRGGGHSYPGHSTCDEGLVLDLSRMRHVELDRATGYVDAQGGALLGSVDDITVPAGLVTPAGIVSHTGLGGLSLGGGIGYTTRSFGLTCDQFVRVRLVTADGDVLWASETENPDLFWALRGGGGNFGVVTDFTLRTHELGPVQSGRLFYKMSEAVDIIVGVSEIMKHAPRETSVTFSLGVNPEIIPALADSGMDERLLSINLVHRGQAEDEIIREIRSFHKALFDTIGTQDFLSVQRYYDKISDRGFGWYMKSGHTRELTREFAERMVESCLEYRKIASPHVAREVYAIQSLGGAASDIAEDATAYSGRAAQWHCAIEVGFTTHDERDRIVSWTKETWAETKKHLDMTTSYVNLSFDEGSLVNVYGEEKLQRLQKIKGIYDPENMFRFNTNIEPLK